MPYIRMLTTLHGKPLGNNACVGLEAVKTYQAKKRYNLPQNLYNLWKKGIDYIDALPPTVESRPSRNSPRNSTSRNSGATHHFK